MRSHSRLVVVVLAAICVLAGTGAVYAAVTTSSSSPLQQTINALPPAKRSGVQQMATQFAQPPQVKDPAHAAPTPPTSCPATSFPTPHIFTIAQPYDPQYTYTDSASGLVNGAPYLIMAGALRTNLNQGYILVTPITIDPCQAQATGIFPQSTVVLLPQQHGAVTLTAINGAVLAYQTADGQTGHFDFVTHAWLP